MYASVTDQAGIYAGEGGFDIEVGGNTDLKGAVIASEATPEKNRLSTDTLTFSDIENKAEYSASSSGVNLDTRKIADAKDSGLTPNIGVKASGEADSTTKSAIAEGTIEVRSGDTDLSNLSRDTASSLNALGKIFDKKTVAEQQELAKVFGEVAFEAIGDIAERAYKKAVKDGDIEGQKLWKDGGSNKVALHALVGGVMANLGGSSFASGAVGAGVNEAIQGELSKITDPALRQWASAVIGTAASSVVGGDAQTGASTAASGQKNNRERHEYWANPMPTQSGTVIKEGEQWYVADGNGMMHPTEAPSAGTMYWADGEYRFAQADGSNSEVLWKSAAITAGVMQPVIIRVAVDSNGNDINIDGRSVVHPDDGKTYLGAVDRDYIYNGGQSMDGKAGMILVEGGSSLGRGTTITPVNNAVRYTPINPGPLPADVAQSFRSATYTTYTTQTETVLYRVYGGQAGEIGSYWTKTPPQGPLQSVIDSALDQNWGNTATQVVKIKVPPGVQLFEGEAAAQRGLVGGGNQLWIKEVDSSWIVH